MVFSPHFQTPEEEYSSVERAKIRTSGLTEDLMGLSYAMSSPDDLEGEVSDVAKSFGIYTQFHRDMRPGERKHMYMVRIPVPGGGPIDLEAWLKLDAISNRYTVSDAYTGTPEPSLRLTTRQDIQLHWVRKADLVECIREICSSGFLTLNGCGDNVRNTKACPLVLSGDAIDHNSLARRIAEHFRLPSRLYLEVFEIPLEGQGQEGHSYPDNLMPRKFKIAVATARRVNGMLVYDNCVDVRTNDIGIVPVIGRPGTFQVFVGGGMGENQGRATFSALALPLGTIEEDGLIPCLDALASIFEAYGDRKNRHWARFKYLVYSMGLQWLRERLSERGVELGPSTISNLDGLERHIGPVTDGDRVHYGLFIENGRIIDGPNGRLKTMMKHIAQTYTGTGVRLYITPGQGIIVSNIPVDRLGEFEAIIGSHGYGKRNGRPVSRMRESSIACVGLPTCRISFTDSERLEPRLIDMLEAKYGNTGIGIGISGCLAQCSMPARKAIGWIGTGRDRYMLKLGGTSDGSGLGMPLIDGEGKFYLQMVPVHRLADCTAALIDLYLGNSDGKEDPGRFFSRVGSQFIIDALRRDPRTSDLMVPVEMPERLEGYLFYREALRREA